jgi:DNA topoisomerase-1
LRTAALCYATDAERGITRRRAGEGFSYRTVSGRPLRDKSTLERIHSLAIPPAWIEVWICPHPNGHLQATGRDARGRKQYRYHARWSAVRDDAKYARLTAFARALPKLRRRVRADLRQSGLPRTKVLAIIVRLLEDTFVRVGNEEYARDNLSFGLTTMQNRHAKVAGSRVRLRFRGKGGTTHDVDIADRRLARMVKRCRELPGQQLFQYIDDDGEPQPVDSGDVNAYLREVTGADFTAKDFRTWGGTLLAAAHLPKEPTEEPPGPAELRAAVEAVSQSLGNTPAICRKCYIHPAVLDAFEDPERLRAWFGARATPSTTKGLTLGPRTLLRFLMRSETRRAA